MPTRNVNLPDELDGSILAKVESGRYQNSYEAKLSALKAAIDEGDASGVMDGNPFEGIRAAIKLSNKPT